MGQELSKKEEIAASILLKSDQKQSSNHKTWSGKMNIFDKHEAPTIYSGDSFIEWHLVLGFEIILFFFCYA